MSELEADVSLLVALSRLIDIINERFGAELSELDQLFFDQIAEAASQNEGLRKDAEVNCLDKFQVVFRQVLESLFIERMEFNEETIYRLHEQAGVAEPGFLLAWKPGV